MNSKVATKKIETAVQETLGWLEATVEIDSLFEGIDHSHSLSRARFEEPNRSINLVKQWNMVQQ